MRWLGKQLFVTFLSILIFSNLAYAQGYIAHQTGLDVSWPNCTIAIPRADFGIVGVNRGLSLTANACLGKEASQFRSNLSLYVNTGYPGHSYALKYLSSPKECSVNDNTCLAYNFGYNAGKYAVNYAYSQGVVSNMWWLDVETVNSWSQNTDNNVASLAGEAQAIKDSAHINQVGYYSTQLQWQIITNNWQNGNVDWLASNSNYRQVAISNCQLSFSSNQTELVQYVASLDKDYVC